MFVQVITLGLVGMLILCLLIQVFLSTRPYFFWGLIMPLLFVVLLVICKAGLSLMGIDLVFTGRAGFTMTMLCLGGMLGSLGVLALCRVAMTSKNQARIRQRNQRMQVREQRLAAEESVRNRYDVPTGR